VTALGVAASRRHPSQAGGRTPVASDNNARDVIGEAQPATEPDLDERTMHVDED
jgi:hypothetical protein